MSSAPGVYRIRKYPNRRFYDSTRSRHVTADELYELVRAGGVIQVSDSQTGDDITSLVLTQMILEHDAPKLLLFPAALLHQVVQANQHILGSFVERYFHQAFSAFLASQQQFERYLRSAGVPEPAMMNPFHWAGAFAPNAGASPPNQTAFTPLGGAPAAERTPEPPPDDIAASASGPHGERNGISSESDALEQMRRQLTELSSRLAALQPAKRAARAGRKKPARTRRSNG
ncbi:MAG: polyhydroxyalkanoate synthesis regulator DNA-binding domain-containing protein [Phycisphaerae bacterium]